MCLILSLRGKENIERNGAIQPAIICTMMPVAELIWAVGRAWLVCEIESCPIRKLYRRVGQIGIRREKVDWLDGKIDEC